VRTLAALFVVLLIWVVGLVAFAQRIERSIPPAEPPVADAVVALTGASDLRLEAAARLLERGKGKRLLISGVNREASRDDILEVSRAVKPIYDCYTAADTIGNAGEIAEWARGKGFTRLIVVTSDYHMPRSILEIRAAMPEAVLIEYPVATGLVDVGGWWRKEGDARRLIVEYSKYLAILARESFLALGPRDDAPVAQTKETTS
jgi:uncharacterized SAM-binding protein YcdF (DUF218 family)